MHMKGYAPMHLACDRGHIEVVRFLLSKGARQDAKVYISCLSKWLLVSEKRFFLGS